MPTLATATQGCPERSCALEQAVPEPDKSSQAGPKVSWVQMRRQTYPAPSRQKYGAAVGAAAAAWRRSSYVADRPPAWRGAARRGSRVARAAVIHEQKGLSPERRRRVHLADGAVGEAQPLLAHAQVADLAGEEEKRGREAEQGIDPRSHRQCGSSPAHEGMAHPLSRAQP